MSILNRWYANGGNEIVYETIEISDGTTFYRFVNGFEDLTADIEGGSTVTFAAIGMETSRPAKTDAVIQTYNFTISNVSGVVSNFIREKVANRDELTIKRRLYTSDDLTAPAFPADEYVVKGGSFDIYSATIEAGYFDVLSLLWPRRLFNTTDFPGLKYV